MSGNLREFVYQVIYITIPQKSPLSDIEYPFAQTRGVSFLDMYEHMAINYSIYVDVAAYNNYYGFRIVISKY